MSFSVSFWGRFGVGLGSLWGVILAPFGAFFVPSWFQNRLRTVFSSKNEFSRNTTFSNVFIDILPNMALQNDPRWFPDGSWIVLLPFWGLFFSAWFWDRFRLRFGSVLGIEMGPGGWHQTGGTPTPGDSVPPVLAIFVSVCLTIWIF